MNEHLNELKNNYTRTHLSVYIYVHTHIHEKKLQHPQAAKPQYLTCLLPCLLKRVRPESAFSWKGMQVLRGIGYIGEFQPKSQNPNIARTSTSHLNLRTRRPSPGNHALFTSSRCCGSLRILVSVGGWGIKPASWGWHYPGLSILRGSWDL